MGYRPTGIDSMTDLEGTTATRQNPGATNADTDRPDPRHSFRSGESYSSRRLNLSPAGSAVSRSRRGFRTSQVESAIPLGPLDVGKIVLSQTREMQNLLFGALHVSPNMAHYCADVVSGRRSRCTTSCETAHHHEGNFASPGIGPDAFFRGQVVHWGQLIPPAVF